MMLTKFTKEALNCFSIRGAVKRSVLDDVSRNMIRTAKVGRTFWAIDFHGGEDTQKLGLRRLNRERGQL
jgi:hypothetical protein